MFTGCPAGCCLYITVLVLQLENVFGVHPRCLSVVVAGWSVRFAIPVHPARCYCSPGLAAGASARGCVLCWRDAGGLVPVAVCCVLPVLQMCAATYSVRAH